MGEAFSVVGELLVDSGVEHIFANSLTAMLLVAFLKRLGCQYCVGHLGITTTAFVLSLYIFAVTFPSELKRGKI